MVDGQFFLFKDFRLAGFDICGGDEQFRPYCNTVRLRNRQCRKRTSLSGLKSNGFMS